MKRMYPIFVVIGIAIVIVICFNFGKKRQSNNTSQLSTSSEKQTGVSERTCSDEQTGAGEGSDTADQITVSKNTDMTKQTDSSEKIDIGEQTAIVDSTQQGRKGNLVALADTEEEAKRIANLYDIDLISFSYGVAVYDTDKDLDKLIKWGEKQGYPRLSINGTCYAN